MSTRREPTDFEQALREKEHRREEDLRALAERRKTPEQLRAENDLFAPLPKLRVRLDEAEPLR